MRENQFVRVDRSEALIGPNHPMASLFGKVFGAALGNSDHVARSGVSSGFYFNFDKIYQDPTLDKTEIETFHKELAQLVEGYVRQRHATCLGLLFPNHGPVGVVQLRSALAERLSVPTIVIHTGERLLRHQIEFEQTGSLSPAFLLKQDARIMLLSDAATSGASIYKGALVARKFGATCTDALVLFDRMQGAKEWLAIKHISIIPILDRRFFERRPDPRVQIVPDRQASRLEFESVSATI